MTQKGTIPWNKGLTKETSESVRKYTDAKIDKKRPDMISNQFAKDMKPNKTSFRKGNKSWNIGKKYSKEFVIEHGIGLNPNSRNRYKGDGVDTNQKKRRATILEKYGHFPVAKKKDSSIEMSMQKELKERSIQFVKHKFIDNIKHSYSCDIFIMPNIVIECDGDYWHKYPKGLDIDKNRNKELQEKGYLILRYWEREIKGNVQGVVDEIENVLMMTNNKKVYEVI